MVEFSEDTNELLPIAVYAAPHETWGLAACPLPAHASKLLAVLNDNGAAHYAALTSVPVLDADDLGAPPRAGATPLAPLPETVRLVPSAGSGAAHGLLRHALWTPSEDASSAVTVQPGALCLWPLDRGDGARARPPALRARATLSLIHI